MTAKESIIEFLTLQVKALQEENNRLNQLLNNK